MDFEPAGLVGGQAGAHVREDVRDFHRLRVIGRGAPRAAAHLIENRPAPIDFSANQLRVLGKIGTRGRGGDRELELARRQRDRCKRSRKLVRRAGGERGQRHEALALRGALAHGFELLFASRERVGCLHEEIRHQYANALDHPLVSVGAGGDGFGRAVVAVSPRIGTGTLMAAFEAGHNDGPWERPDDYRKYSGLLRYTRGDAVNGVSVRGMAYNGEWNSTDQVPQRAIDDGIIGRFGALDTSDGGDSYRYSGSFDWQATAGSHSTRVTAYGIGYNLNLWSNFTFFLDDPGSGDQFQQADHRFVSGVKISHRRLNRWGARPTQNTLGAQLRHDGITKIGLYHTVPRERLSTTRQDNVGQTSGAEDRFLKLGIRN